MENRNSRGTDRAAVLTDPVRNPEGASARTRSKRALFLLLLTVFVPGGAQVVAGNRKLGRVALTVTLCCWFALLAAGVLALINRDLLIDLLARPTVQLVLAVVLGVLAVGWLALFINTIALIRPRLLAPGMQVIVSTATVLLVLATSGVLGYGTYVLNTGRQTIENVFASGPAFDPIDGRYNFLVMGGDAGANRIGLRPDSMSIFSVEASSGKTAVISLPRNFQNAQFSADSPLKQVFPNGFNCGNECILNALYPTVEEKYANLYPGAKNPGAEAMMDAAEGITGIKIQAYVLIDMAGFADFIDAMGGVTVTSGGWVPYNGKYWEGTRVRTHWFEPGKHTFTGKQALWFARSRDFTTDYHRIRRQQCLQQAMINQFNPQTVLTRFSQIMDAGKEILQTDIPQDQLGSFVNLAGKSRQNAFKRLTLGAPDFGTAADRFSTYPDFDQIRSRVKTLLAEASASAPTKAAKPSKSSSPSSSGGSSESPSGGSAASPSSSSASASSSGAGNVPKEDIPTTQPDGSPITEDYLVQLELAGQTGLISTIASNNDECSAE
ncbi:hypothetical protein GCM10023081_17010 [Arthrobacter ginkgonis]|uniref:Cell envelope-related transcriptional attenuator domain-containing protein n=1 Tax=Arthrobacter ginkgonis TaxID=1630594 RepID=A0ABP7C740_9MICC